MIQKKNNIVFGWFIAFIVMVLIWLYSPEKTKTDYSVINFVVETTSISYIGKTENAPKEKNQIYNSKLSKIPKFSFNNHLSVGATKHRETNSDYYASNHFEANYAVSINDEQNNHSYTSNNGTTLSGFSNQNLTYSSIKRNKESVADYGQISILSSGISAINEFGAIKSVKSASELVGSKHGFLSLSTDLSSVETFSSMNNFELQKVSNDIDPGGDGEMGEPIPVGDGWVILLIMVMCYTTFKILRIRHLTSHK